MKTLYYYAGAVCSLLFSVNLQAQSTLEVRCYTTTTPYNAVYVDENMIEYAAIIDPAFYVVVFDSTCTAWQTDYNGDGYDFGNAETGRSRAESYFVFRQNDAAELTGMNTMLTTIPANHTVVIYTPQEYNAATIETLFPALLETLGDKWGGIVDGNDMMVLYGIEGQPQTFLSDNTVDGTDANGDYISFMNEMNCNASLSVAEQATETLNVIYTGNGAFKIETTGTPDGVVLIDFSGRQLAAATKGNEVVVPGGLPSGVYIVRGMLDGHAWSRKVAAW